LKAGGSIFIFIYNYLLWLSRKPKLNAQIKITKKTGFPLARE